MYNEKIKMQFIDSGVGDKDASILQVLFDGIEAEETKRDKDISRIKVAEYPYIILDYMHITTLDRLMFYVRLLKRYRTFCYNMEYLDAETYELTEYASDESMIDVMFEIYYNYKKDDKRDFMLYSPKIFCEALSEALDGISLEKSEANISSNEMLLLFIMLQYYGVKAGDVCTLKKSDIIMYDANSTSPYALIVKYGDVIKIGGYVAMLLQRRLNSECIKNSNGHIYELDKEYLLLYNNDDPDDNDRYYQYQRSYVRKSGNSDMELPKLVTIIKRGVIHKICQCILRYNLPHKEPNEIIAMYNAITGSSVANAASKRDIILEFKLQYNYMMNHPDDE